MPPPNVATVSDTDNWQTETQTHLDAFLRGHHQQITRGKNTKRRLVQEITEFLYFYDTV